MKFNLQNKFRTATQGMISTDIFAEIELVFLWLVVNVESFVSCWVLVIRAGINQVVVFLHVENVSLLTQEHAGVDYHIECKKDRKSVWEEVKSSVGLVFGVVLFFEVDVITSSSDDEVSPKRSEEKLISTIELELARYLLPELK